MTPPAPDARSSRRWPTPSSARCRACDAADAGVVRAIRAAGACRRLPAVTPESARCAGAVDRDDGRAARAGARAVWSAGLPPTTIPSVVPTPNIPAPSAPTDLAVADAAAGSRRRSAARRVARRRAPIDRSARRIWITASRRRRLAQQSSLVDDAARSRHDAGQRLSIFLPNSVRRRTARALCRYRTRAPSTGAGMRHPDALLAAADAAERCVRRTRPASLARRRAPGASAASGAGIRRTAGRRARSAQRAQFAAASARRPLRRRAASDLTTVALVSGERAGGRAIHGVTRGGGALAHGVYAAPRATTPQPADKPSRRADLRSLSRQARFPDPATAGPWQAADLARQRRDDAKAAGGDRPARAFLRIRELQHSSRRPCARRALDRRL